MKKEHKMLVLNDERRTITHKKVKGRRTLKFFKRFSMSDWAMLHTSKKFVIVGLFSHDKKGEITYLVKEKENRRTFTNVYHVNISWRRLKKRLIVDYTNEHYKRFY